MDLTSIIVLIISGLLLMLSLIRDRKKTLTSLKVALNVGKRLLPSIAAIILLVGIMVGFVPPHWVARTIGTKSGAPGVVIATFIGAVLFIPAIIAFPLAKSFIDMGAGTMATAAFITTLTMVGFVFLPLEIKELGKRFALTRNAASLISAVIIAVIVGAIL